MMTMGYSQLVLALLLVFTLTETGADEESCVAGWPIKGRHGPDSAGLTMVSLDQKFTCHGKITQWQFQGKTSKPFHAIVWRPLDKSTTNMNFKIVGINEIPPPNPLNRPNTYDVPVKERIRVIPGDVIGWSFHEGVLTYNIGGEHRVSWLGGDLVSTLEAGQEHTFTSVQHRQYSIQATVVGTGFSTDDYNYLGCFRDGGPRALPEHTMDATWALTIGLCATHCKYRGNRYFGVQNTNQCYCGSNEDKYDKYKEVAESECHQKCTGDKTQKCGAGGRNSVFDLWTYSSADYKYLGCFVDKGDSALPDHKTTTNALTVDKCATHCRDHGSRYFSVQNGNTCSCGNDKISYDRYGEVDDSECNKACPGDATQTCGAEWRNKVYDLWRFASAEYKYVGCFVDKDDRALPEHRTSTNALTVDLCATHCKSKGSRYFAVQIHHTCFCGSDGTPYDRYGKVDDSQCHLACTGDKSQHCGAAWRNQVYDLWNNDNKTEAVPEADSSETTLCNVCIDLTLLCGGTEMTAIFGETVLPYTQPSDVHLSDPSCVGLDNGNDKVIVSTNYHECNSSMEETETHMIFRNSLILGKKDSDSPFSSKEIALECRVPRLHRADLNIMSATHNTKIGYGNFSFTLQMFHDDSFSTPYQTEEYPVDVKIGDTVYLAGIVQNVNGLGVLFKECYATPSADPKDASGISLIQNGCVSDESVTQQDSDNPSEALFYFKAFGFQEDSNNLVYVHCQMLVCDLRTADSRCKQGCVETTRKRRSVDVLHTISSGPLVIHG